MTRQLAILVQSKPVPFETGEIKNVLSSLFDEELRLFTASVPDLGRDEESEQLPRYLAADAAYIDHHVISRHLSTSSYLVFKSLMHPVI